MSEQATGHENSKRIAQFDAIKSLLPEQPAWPSKPSVIFSNMFRADRID
jgi:hypothetical protein